MAEEQAEAPPPSSNAAATPLGHSVISMVNKLQDIFAQLGSQSAIELPQVAVVGSQSSGKSSVLEALVGRDFLPRGNDICTRRPLVLQLEQNKRKADGTGEEWGEFLHLPGKKFFDFNEIRKEIQAETEREAGGNKGVSDKNIRLKIVSPNVLDIALVDLPGLTKVPVGDQPSDIEARIRTMIMSYIKRPSCLILAVTPANSDLANSDALQMAGIADPDEFLSVLSSRWLFALLLLQLDIMDRGTDARNFLLGKVIPLRLGYVGVVNRSQEDILLNRSIKDALVAEEKFFRSRPILVQHIMTVLPVLKSRINAELVSVAKEHASYGEITESKDVDPCEDLTDDDIRTAIQNSTGTRSALFVPDVPFEVLVRRQIARLSDPSLQCARFIYDELIKMDYINTSHPNFVGGSKAVEMALQQIKSSRIAAPNGRLKDTGDSEKAPTSDRSLKSRAIFARQVNGIVPEQGVRPAADVEKTAPAVSSAGSTWGISSIFGGHDNRTSVKEDSTSKPFHEPLHSVEQGVSMIHLREPPSVLRPSETHSDQEVIEITVTKLLLRSYYDIVRKNIEDSVPKAIMHFLVNHTKRDLHNVFIGELYRDNLFEEMLREPDEISRKRKRTREKLRMLQQAFRVSARYIEFDALLCETVDELPLEAETIERGYSMSTDQTGLPKPHGLSNSSLYNTSASTESYTPSSKNPKSRKSGELQSPLHADANNGRWT
ncbi:hypothetical protein DH2020_030796 [Rehmannia glutinosa]|uniref:Dynamin-related protein 3A n=1 Tax=Rehmannia glutinosa TaxID=99300 RepID=A0ABR0VK03_REHGL